MFTSKKILISSGFSEDEVIENIKKTIERKKDKYFKWTDLLENKDGLSDNDQSNPCDFKP